MSTERTTREGKRPSHKRLLAAGRKVDGVWQVKTFLRAATSDARETFWETAARRRAK
jgi:hypothetical protein